MNAFREFSDRLLNFLLSIREEIAVLIIGLLVPTLIYFVIRSKLNSKNPDAIGMRFLEELPAQTLVKIRNPGNIREIYRRIPFRQNVLIRFGKMNLQELKYATFLLKEFGKIRGVPVIEVDQGLFLVRGAQKVENYNALENSGARIVDFQGKEVIPN